MTGPNGQTATKDVTTSITNGTGTRVVEVTKPDGTTDTRTETFTVAKTDAPSKP